MKNSNETVWNRNRDLPACSAVPQPARPPRAPTHTDKVLYVFYAYRGMNFEHIHMRC